MKHLFKKFGQERESGEQQSQAEKKRVKIEKTEEAGVNLSLENVLRVEREIEKSKRERIASILNTTIDRISVEKPDKYDDRNMKRATCGHILYHYGDLDLGHYISRGGDTLPRIVAGYLILHSMTSAENLTLPDIITGGLDIRSLTRLDGISRWPSYIGRNVQVHKYIVGQDREFLENKYPGKVIDW